MLPTCGEDKLSTVMLSDCDVDIALDSRTNNGDHVMSRSGFIAGIP